MSTAGKVLTVLILLVMVGWIIMLSAVTQLNINWQTKITKVEKDLEAADAKFAKATTDYHDFTDRTKAEQVDHDRDYRDRQTRIVVAEARKSIKTEDLTRVQFQLADYQAAVARAGTNKANREAEKTRAETDLAARRTENAHLQDQNTQLRDQLNRLQDDFKRLLTNNSKLNNRNSADRPSPQPTSERRPSPSS